MNWTLSISLGHVKDDIQLYLQGLSKDSFASVGASAEKYVITEKGRDSVPSNVHLKRKVASPLWTGVRHGPGRSPGVVRWRQR